VCQIDSLRRCRNKQELLSALESLPPTLDATYERMFLQIPAEDKSRAQNMLQWLVFSKAKPSPLHLAESAVLRIDRLFDCESRLYDTSEVYSILGSLVTRDNQVSYSDTRPATVQLAHYSIKEYLFSNRLRKSPASDFALTYVSGHEALAKSCLLYLVSQREHLRQTEFDKLDKLYPLTTYAIKHWVYHATHALRALPTDRQLNLTNFILECLTTKNTFFRSWYKHNAFSAQEQPPGPPICFAANFGFPLLVNRLVEMKTEVNVHDPEWGTPLQAAAFLGNLNMIKSLVRGGANVMLTSPAESASVLSIAIQKKDLEMIKFFLESGADPNCADVHWGTPLQHAVSLDDLPAVQLLIQAGARLTQSSAKITDPPLVLAIQKHHVAVLKYLLNLYSHDPFDHGSTLTDMAGSMAFFEAVFQSARQGFQALEVLSNNPIGLFIESEFGTLQYHAAHRLLANVARYLEQRQSQVFDTVSNYAAWLAGEAQEFRLRQQQATLRGLNEVVPVADERWYDDLD
jgi:hypothetical protein